MSDTTQPALTMPARFLWGAATSAHQNEGYNANNQWAAWEKMPGRIYGGQRAGAAAGWWDLDIAAADFDRAGGLGLNSLRISVEWSRIEPEPGVFDRPALDHYARMVKLLRARGIEPLVTLHHFTDPIWLTALGAWENPRVEDYFARYVTRVVEELGDSVSFWCTINEPIVYAVVGFLSGYFPPGVRSMRRTVKVLRHMLFAHARAYRIIHRLQNSTLVGTAHNMRVMLPLNAARAADRGVVAVLDQIANRSVFEAVFNGRLTPLLGLGQRYSPLLDSSDYIGLNYYTTVRVAFDPSRPTGLLSRESFSPCAELSDFTPLGEAYSEVDAGGLYTALKRLAKYGKPIYITENGLPDRNDDMRSRFITGHLAAAWRAIQEGVDLRGYYHWTLVDNFEWAAGWSLRFGLFALDPVSGVRAPRPSAAVYARIVRSNAISPDLL